MAHTATSFTSQLVSLLYALYAPFVNPDQHRTTRTSSSAITHIESTHLNTRTHSTSLYHTSYCTSYTPFPPPITLTQRVTLYTYHNTLSTSPLPPWPSTSFASKPLKAAQRSFKMPFPLSTPSDFSTLPWNDTPPRRPCHHGLSATRPHEDPVLFDSTDNSSVPFINHLSTPPRIATHLQSRKKRPSSPHTPRAIKRTRRTAPSPSPSTSGARYLSPRSPTLSSSSFSPLLFAEVELTARPTLHKPATDMSFLSNLQPNFLSAKVEVVFDAEGRVEMVTGPNTG